MTYRFLEIAGTPSVKAAQEANGSGAHWAGFQGRRESDRFTEAETRFIAARDSFYMATVSENGWPYVQHRGGPAGFLRVIDDRTLAFADFRGNRQYISIGNLAADNRAALILMDYPNRRRLKIFARIEPKDLAGDPELAGETRPAGLPGITRARAARPARGVRLELSATPHAAFHRGRTGRRRSRRSGSGSKNWKRRTRRCGRGSRRRRPRDSETSSAAIGLRARRRRFARRRAAKA